MGSKSTFGERIRELRKKIGLSQRELAERVARRLKSQDGRGFDFSYLSKIENDKMSPPSVPAILALAHELGDDADADDLLALAGKAPADLGQALKASQGARAFYRSAVDLGLSESDWRQLLASVKEKKKQS